jgi:hypothetical protein
MIFIVSKKNVLLLSLSRQQKRLGAASYDSVPHHDQFYA